ncbi:glycosyltransferase family 4 protein [Flavobacterium pedocola]
MDKGNRFKIFVDCHVFDDGFQGTRTYIQGIYTYFIKCQEFEFFLASNNSDALKSIFGSHPNVNYITYKYHNKFGRLLLDIPQIIKRYQIDYAHFQYIVSPFKRCKYIVTTHDVLFIDFPEYFPFFNRIKNTILYKFSAKFSDIRLTVSGYSQKTIDNHFSLKDYHITPNAINDAFFENYDKALIQKEVYEKFKLKEYIIYISRWEPRKNQQLVLKAFVDLKLYESHQLLFIGDETIDNKAYADIYEKLDASVKSKIYSFQKTDFQTMLMLLRGAKAAVYPSIAEGFGIPPLESIAAKIPTLCSNKTAMSDFDFFEDFFFDPYDQNEFNRKLKMILENDFSEKINTISQKIQNRYDWEKSAEILKSLIEVRK